MNPFWSIRGEVKFREVYDLIIYFVKWSFMKFSIFWVNSNTVYRGCPQVSTKNLLNCIQSETMCTVVVSKTSCKHRNHPILRKVVAPHQDFFFFKNHDFSRFWINFSDGPSESNGDLKTVPRVKILHYHQLYLNRPDPIVFMSVAVDTSGHIYDDCSRNGPSVSVSLLPNSVQRNLAECYAHWWLV